MSLLSVFRFEKLMHPGFLILLPAVGALLAAELTKRAPGAIVLSTGDALASLQARLGAQRRAWVRGIPAALRAAGLAMFVVALARPIVGLRPHIERAEVVDIMLCVDVSGSMRAMDFVAGKEPVDRLTVTKAAVREFMENRKFRSDDRFGIDRLGLILYAGYAWTQCPLTLDYGILEREIELAYIDDSDRAKSGTAIGSAIGLAVSRLAKSEAESKVIVLLTDGQNNRGELDPITAARIAAEYGIRIYTIGAGSTGQVLVPQNSLFGQRLVPHHIPIDEDALRQIADATGAKVYRATDTEALKEAYGEINELETTEIEIGDYYDHEEGFAPWAAAGALAMALGLFSRRAWCDPVP